MADSVKLEVTGVRYFDTRRGTGYQCTTNVKNVEIWNDGNGGGTWIPPHHPYTKPYQELNGGELETLIDDYEKNGDQSSDSMDEERLKAELQWWRDYGYYVSRTHKNVDAEACGFADGDEEYQENFK